MTTDGIHSLAQKASELNVEEGVNPRLPTAYYHSDMPPPAPELDRGGIVVTDITAQFRNAASNLDVGELVKDDYFSLFEAVSALEIMDPKMDSGHLAPGDTLEEEYSVSRDLLPDEVISIIDQLLCHEMAWHIGHPLSQTVFTSLYIEHILEPKPKNLEITRFDGLGGSYQEESMAHRTLRAYCLGLLKTCAHVNNRVKQEHYYEEEDFVTHTYNRSLLEDVPDQSVLDFLHSTTQCLSSESNQTSDVWLAVFERLQFRIAFLQVVIEAAGDTRDAPSICPLWERVLATLPEVKASRDLGKPVPESFSAKLQRKLASTVPPRPIVEISFETAFATLEQLCRDGKVAAEVLEYHDSHCLMTFVSLFQARKPQPPVFVRTLVQNYLFGGNIFLGKHSIRRLLDDDLACLVLPNDQLLDRENDEIEVPTDRRHKMAKMMEMFRMRAANSYLDILRSICQNRSRIRRSLCHTITDWDSLQLDSEELDQKLREYTKEEGIIDPAHGFGPMHAFPLSSWAYFHKLRQMEWIIQLGFELEIYQPDELAGMYWSLSFLAQTRVRHIERIRGFVVRKMDTASLASTPQTRGWEFGKALSFLNLSMLEASATENFAYALMCLYTVLKRLELVPTPHRPYSTDAQRYELRMKPFLHIILPELTPYPQFAQIISQSSQSTQKLLSTSLEAIGRAKKEFERLSKLDAGEAFCRGSEASWKANVQACLRACIATGIAVSMVKKGIEGEGEVKWRLRVEVVEGGSGYHDWWTVPKVSPVP